MSSKFRMRPGMLFTTQSASALSDDQAAEVYNCDTSQGTWKIDRRYRRLPTKPTIATTSNTTTAGGYAGGASTVARTGGTCFFADPAVPAQEAALLPEIVALDGTCASATGLTPGLKTNILYASDLNPGATVPSTAFNMVANLTVSAAAVIGTGLETDIAQDFYALTLDGAPILTVPLVGYTVLTNAISPYVFNIPLGPLGITPAMIMAGRLGFQIGYSAVPDNSSAYNPGNWNVGMFPASPQSLSGAGGLTLNTPFTIRAYWIGTGTPPPYVILQETIGASAAGSATGGAYDLTTSADDGLGAVNAGTVHVAAGVGAPAARTSTGTASARFTVVAPLTLGFVTYPGVATSIVTPVASASTAPTTGEASVLSTTAAASVIQPTAGTVKVDAIKFSVSYDHTTTAAGPQAIGYGSFGGHDCIDIIYGQGVFEIDAKNVPTPGLSDWSAELTGETLDLGKWMIWQYGQWLYFTSETFGVYYRSIGVVGDWTPLYRDPANGNISTGALATTVRPPYDSQLPFISGADTIAVTTSATTSDDLIFYSATAVIDPTTNLPYITTPDWVTGTYNTAWIEFEITLATPRNWNHIPVLGYQMVSMGIGFAGDGNDGFDPASGSNQITITNVAGTTFTAVPLLFGTLRQPSGTYNAWVDLRGVSTPILGSVHKIKIRFGTYQTGRGNYVLRSLIGSGMYYHDGIAANTQNTLNTGILQYAYDYSEGVIVRHANLINVPVATHLGTSKPPGYDPGYPYFGSLQSLDIPIGEVPYTGAATINLYRKIGANWQRIATGSNASDLVFEDRLADSVVAANVGSYPITALNFDFTPPSATGVATGVICGCAWKGSNCYGGNNGKVYFSRANYPNTVLWDNVVLTNDVGSTDLGPPRTSVVPDNTADPILLMIPGESLYVFTKRECYVFITGETAATSSFPRKMDGVRGALGSQAGCLFQGMAMVGARDGLWMLKKSTNVLYQPDVLIEVTKNNRGAWADFVSTTPENVVVRQLLGAIWCFNGASYFHITVDGYPITGMWADGRQVVDACSDPFYGMLLLLNDGSVGVIGDYLTDGGILLDGSDGAAPTWSYKTGRKDTGVEILRVAVWAETVADSMGIGVNVEAEQGNHTLVITGQPVDIVSHAFDMDPRYRRLGGATYQFTLAGNAADTVRAVEFEIVERDISRGV